MIATLGGGCFWCLEAVFLEFEGVTAVQSGYAGGHTPNPTYREVCAKNTGHAEVVQVAFDPEILPYAELLRIFFTIHDPTTPDRQGADRGPQYRSIILFHSSEQEEDARTIMAEVQEAGWWGDAPLVTQLVPASTFYPAEPEHDQYFARNPSAPYCQFVVEPKVVKARTSFAHRLRR
jgi:peptide-methionine (S)-S-oxide reductase